MVQVQSLGELMWMKVTCTVLKLKVKQVIYESKILWQHKKVKATRYLARDLKNLSILLENSAEGLWSRRALLPLLSVCLCENTLTNLVVQRRVQLEHSSHIVKVGVDATCLHFSPRSILNEWTGRWAHFWNYTTGTLTSWKWC